MEEAFVKIDTSHEETNKYFNLYNYKKGFAEFSQWQGECHDAYNNMVLKIIALEKKDAEKMEQVELFLNEVAELQGMVESMRDKLCTCNDYKVITSMFLVCQECC